MAGCQSPPPPASAEAPITRLQPHLGTFVSITVHAPATPQTQAAINAAFAEFAAVDELLSIHQNDSQLARAHDGKPVSAELRAILEKAQAIAKDTGGAFDPTVRPLADLWGFIRKEGYRLPTGAELAKVKPLVNYRKVFVRENRLLFGAPGMGIDPGGFGKGYAVDRAIDALQRHGIRSALVKAGGDLRVIGLPPGREHWTILIEDPQKKGRRVPVQLRAGALSTSGNYENFFVQDGVRYGHLLDPRTGLPVREVAACTLTAPTCLQSDAYATAACILGVVESRRRFAGRFGLRFVKLDGEVVKIPAPKN